MGKKLRTLDESHYSHDAGRDGAGISRQYISFSLRSVGSSYTQPNMKIPVTGILAAVCSRQQSSNEGDKADGKIHNGKATVR